MWLLFVCGVWRRGPVCCVRVYALVLVPPNLYICMYVCKDSAAPAHARTRAHRPAAIFMYTCRHVYLSLLALAGAVAARTRVRVWLFAIFLISSF